MDRFKILFVCKEMPDHKEGLNGFKVGKQYEGRSYNGFFEVSTKWGSNHESKLINQGMFKKYFQLIEYDTLIKTSA
ncbi:MAG: hypothetical protein ACJAT1_001242 [Marivirga sp.]|jgi:hypothetical protein